MVEWITRTFGKPLESIGAKLGMNKEGSAGLVANLANNIAVFNIMGDMNPKAKLLTLHLQFLQHSYLVITLDLLQVLTAR